jgi:hypothetical protein
MLGILGDDPANRVQDLVHGGILLASRLAHLSTLSFEFP